jgi:hypothetical protein
MHRKAAQELLHIKGSLERVDEIIDRGKDAARVESNALVRGIQRTPRSKAQGGRCEGTAAAASSAADRAARLSVSGSRQPCGQQGNGVRLQQVVDDDEVAKPAGYRPRQPIPGPAGARPATDPDGVVATWHRVELGNLVAVVPGRGARDPRAILVEDEQVEVER